MNLIPTFLILLTFSLLRSLHIYTDVFVFENHRSVCSFSQRDGEATTAGMGTAKVAGVAGAKAKGARRASQTEGEESDTDH